MIDGLDRSPAAMKRDHGPWARKCTVCDTEFESTREGFLQLCPACQKIYRIHRQGYIYNKVTPLVRWRRD